MRLRKEWRVVGIDPDGVWDNETPLSALEQTQTAEIVQLCVSRLKMEYQEVILLREFEQLTYAEIAGVTGASESAVKSRLFKARKALAGKLSPYFERDMSLRHKRERKTP
jgi:RNA polymerase sigma-70 factor (ECF subfamily)